MEDGSFSENDGRVFSPLQPVGGCFLNETTQNHNTNYILKT